MMQKWKWRTPLPATEVQQKESRDTQDPSKFMGEGEWKMEGGRESYEVETGNQ